MTRSPPKRRYDRPAVAVNANGTNGLFVATYHDTPDRRLARAGIALRRRMENGTGLWEAQIAGTTVCAPGGLRTLPEEVARRLSAPLRRGELVEIARLRAGEEDVALLEGQHVVRRYPDLADAERQLLPAPDAEAPARKAPALEHVRAYLRAQIAEVERTDPVLRLGDDIEALHELRVAVRRSRAVLRAARRLFDREWIDSLRAELRWLGGELGPARDLDVLLERLRAEEGTGVRPMRKQLETERRRARARVVAALESERYLSLLDGLAGAVDAPPVRSIDVSLEAIAGKSFRKLCAVMSGLGSKPTDAELHRARIHAKRARYAAELAQPVAGKRARRFVDAAKRFQDVVGAHQDAAVAEEYIRSVLARSKSTSSAFAAGRLVERQRAGRRTARSDLPEAWKRLERRGRKAWAA